MSRIDGQGQSELVTEWKERGIGAACAVSLRIFRAKWGTRYRFLHFDLHAGSGINEQVGCIGSPLTFLRQAQADGIANFSAHFCELDDGRVRQLRQQPEVIGDPARVFVHHGDNRGLLPAIPHIVRNTYKERPEFAQGTVLADPNSTELPLEELSTLAAECPRLDLIINWNATAFKRKAGVTGERLTLGEAIARLNRAHWLIRESVGAWQFTIVVGRNFNVGPHRSLGFHELDSDMGQQILSRADLTREQLKQHARHGQQRLFK